MLRFRRSSRPNAAFPLDAIELLCAYLVESNSYGTIASLTRCSKACYELAWPFLACEMDLASPRRLAHFYDLLALGPGLMRSKTQEERVIAYMDDDAAQRAVRLCAKVRMVILPCVHARDFRSSWMYKGIFKSLKCLSALPHEVRLRFPGPVTVVLEDQGQRLPKKHDERKSVLEPILSILLYVAPSTIEFRGKMLASEAIPVFAQVGGSRRRLQTVVHHAKWPLGPQVLEALTKLPVEYHFHDTDRHDAMRHLGRVGEQGILTRLVIIIAQSMYPYVLLDTGPRDPRPRSRRAIIHLPLFHPSQQTLINKYIMAELRRGATRPPNPANEVFRPWLQASEAVQLEALTIVCEGARLLSEGTVSKMSQ